MSLSSLKCELREECLGFCCLLTVVCPGLAHSPALWLCVDFIGGTAGPHLAVRVRSQASLAASHRKVSKALPALPVCDHNLSAPCEFVCWPPPPLRGNLGEEGLSQSDTLGATEFELS